MEPATSDAKYRLRRDEGVAAGVRRVARGRIDAARAHLRHEKGEDLAASIHSVRKDLKKIRAVLRLVREDLGEPIYRAENGRYRDLGRRLSASRDAQVKLKTLEDLEKHFVGEFPVGSSLTWADALEEDRVSILRTGEGVTPAVLAQSETELAEAAELIDAWTLGDRSWRLISPGLLRAYRSGRKALGSLHRAGTDDDVHEFRKRAKDLWYQLRLLRDAWPGVLGANVDQLHELTELLGDHHDLSVLAADLSTRSGIVADRERLAGLIEERQEELLKAAIGLGSRIYVEKPGAFERRVHAYWRLWRR